MTRGDPLVVKAHQTVSAQGDVPPSFAGGSPKSTTNVKIDIISGVVGVTTEDHVSTGSTWSSSKVKVDDYLKYGVGLYRYVIVNRGPGWRCTFVGYVKLDGDPLSKPIGQAGVGVVALGAAGMLFTKRAKAKPTSSDPAFNTYRPASIASARRPGTQPVQLPPAEPVRTVTRALGGPGVFCAIALVLPLAVMPLFGMGGGSTAPLWSKTVWKRGRPVLGLLSGLLLGSGATVLLWQYAVWTLNIRTAIGLPVVVAVLGAIRGFLGTPYKLQVRLPTTDDAAPAASG